MLQVIDSLIDHQCFYGIDSAYIVQPAIAS
jgi:hypothetical protein